MKDYREMAEEILLRRDNYRMKRRKNMRKAASVLSAFCVITVLVAGSWYGQILTEDASGQVSDVQPQNITNRDTNGEADRPEAEQKTKQDFEQEAQKSAIKDLSADKNEENLTKTEDSGVNDHDISKYNNNDAAEPTGTESTIDMPVSDIPGDTGALTAYDEVWGGCYMDENGRWVVWLTEDTPENRQEVFSRNPSLNESNTIFKTAAYSKAYLTDLLARISSAMGEGKLPFVTTAALREDKNCVEVTTVFNDPASINQILAFDTLGVDIVDGAIEIIYDSEGHVIMDLIKEREH